jgi:hypothetical protein
MAAPLSDQICRTDISYPAAVEIARQMTAGIGNGNANLISACGINATPAIELARQINAGVFSAPLLCAAMWNPITAVAIKVASGL